VSKSRNPHKRALEKVPNEADWGDYRPDLDAQWAHDQFCGRTNEQISLEDRCPFQASDPGLVPSAILPARVVWVFAS
jgi:hypothetical protein